MKAIGALLLIPVLLATAPQAAEAARARKVVKAPSKPAKAVDPVSVDRHKTRVFIPLRNAKVRWRAAKIGAYEMELTGQTSGPYYADRAIGAGALHHVRISAFENRASVKASWRYAAPVSVKVRPDGVEMIVANTKLAPSFRTVASGVKYWEGQRWSGAGPMRVRALKLDADDVALEPAIAAGNAHRMGLETVSSMARRRGAIAAVNGGFYSPRNGAPQGTLIQNGVLVSRTMLDRPSLWVEPDGDAYIRVQKPFPFVTLEDGSAFRAQAVNESAGRNRVTLYTAHYGKTTRTIADPSRWELAVAPNGMIVAEGHGNLSIPAGGYVLSGQGSGYKQLRSTIGLGQQVAISFAQTGKVAHAIGGGPTLITNAKVSINSAKQKFRADVARSRTARTAVGLTKDGGYVLVSIDGRRPGYSSGATLTELAVTMRELGVIEALNLDGGGSTTLWLKGHTVNRPSDGRERPVSNALLVVPRKAGVATLIDQLFASR